MSELEIRTRDDRTEFLPGEELTGYVTWMLDKLPGKVELRLFWRTEGKGTKDVNIVDKIIFDNARQQERRDFRFQLPNGPYSFSGRLISLIWALELVLGAAWGTERLEIIISPTKSEITLSGGLNMNL